MSAPPGKTFNSSIHAYEHDIDVTKPLQRFRCEFMRIASDGSVVTGQVFRKRCKRDSNGFALAPDIHKRKCQEGSNRPT